MPNKKTKTSKVDGFVPILFADSMEDAKEYCQLLEDHGVKALVDSEQDGNNLSVGNKIDENNETDANDISHGVPIFVHKSDVDEANEVITEHDDLDTFGLDDDELSDAEDDDDFGMGPDMGDDNDLYGLEDGFEELL
jgi:hypothetical protein